MGQVLLQKENRSTRRKPAMLGRVKLDYTLLTRDQGNFNQITAKSRKRTLVTVVRDTRTTTVSPPTQVLPLRNNYPPNNKYLPPPMPYFQYLPTDNSSIK